MKPIRPRYPFCREVARQIKTFLVIGLGPFIEEIFFRGFVYGALKHRFGIRKAIFLSALFFSFLHTNPMGFFPILVLGLLLAYLYEKTGSLIPSITVHMLHNGVLLGLLFIVKEISKYRV